VNRATASDRLVWERPGVRVARLILGGVAALGLAGWVTSGISRDLARVIPPDFGIVQRVEFSGGTGCVSATYSLELDTLPTSLAEQSASRGSIVRDEGPRPKATFDPFRPTPIDPAYYTGMDIRNRTLLFGLSCGNLPSPIRDSVVDAAFRSPGLQYAYDTTDEYLIIFAPEQKMLVLLSSD
jgi:hypothetical protein